MPPIVFTFTAPLIILFLIAMQLPCSIAVRVIEVTTRPPLAFAQRFITSLGGRLFFLAARELTRPEKPHHRVQPPYKLDRPLDNR